MFHRVVVPVALGDLPHAAVDHATAIARQAGAELSLLTVKAHNVDPAQARNHLARIQRAHRLDANLSVIEAAEPAAAISAVGCEPGNLLCMATRARRSAPELVFGSVSLDVMRACRHPVVLIGPSCGPAPDGYRSLVIALDGSEIAGTILPAAAEWCSHLGLDPWLFRVMPGLVPFERGESDVEDLPYPRRVTEWFTAHDLKVEWETSDDRDVAAAIARSASQHGPAIVALSTHGRSGLSRIVMGSVALAVARRATTPVLVRHPQPSGDDTSS